MPLQLNPAELQQVIGGAPSVQQAAPSGLPEGVAPAPVYPVTPQETSNLVQQTAEAGQAYGIDTKALGLTPEDIRTITGIQLPPAGPPSPPLPPQAATQQALPSQSVQPEGSIIPSGLRINADGRIEVASSANPANSRSGIIENLGAMAKGFLDNPARGMWEFGKGLVTDVVEGFGSALDLIGNAPNQYEANAALGSVMDRLKINPNDFEARNQLQQLKQTADQINQKQTNDLWKTATAATFFIPFAKPLSLTGKALAAAGMEEASSAILSTLEKKGIDGVAARLVDRAGKGALVGGTYGYFSTQGNLDAAKNSALMMGGLFGAGPIVAAPFKAAFGAAGAGMGKAINSFGQIPAVAQARANIYNGPIGKIWDNIAMAPEGVFERAGLGHLVNNMHVARVEAVRLAGQWVAAKERNLETFALPQLEQISGLVERRITPSQLVSQVGQEEAAPLIRAAADESRRLKSVGQLLKAWGIPVYNSSTGELYNFVMRDNYVPHIIVNSDALLTDPKLRAQAIAAIAKRTGKSTQEAEADLVQWGERAKADAPNEAMHGVPGRATLEARLYGLPGYSMDLRNVLDLYYQRAAKLLAIHRRLGRHVTNFEPPGPDEAAAAAALPVDPASPIPGAGGNQLDLFAPAEKGAPATAGQAVQQELFGPAPAAAAPVVNVGDKVVVTGKTGRPIPGTLLEKDINDKGQHKVRVGTPGKRGTRTLTVSASKVAPASPKPVVAQIMVPEVPAEIPAKKPRPAPPSSIKRAPENIGIKKGSDVYLGNRRVRITGSTKEFIVGTYADTNTEVKIPKNSRNVLRKPLAPELPPLKQGDQVLFEGRPYTVLSQSKDGVRLRSEDGGIGNFFRKDIALAADRDKPVIYNDYSPKIPQDMSPAEFASEFNNVLHAIAQTRARTTFKNIPPNDPAWAAYEAGDWKTFSRAMGFSDPEINDFDQFVKLAGGGDPSAPHYDPTDIWHRDLYDWWQSQPKPAEVPTTPASSEMAKITITPTGEKMTLPEVRKALIAQGMTPQEVGDIMKELAGASKVEAAAAANLPAAPPPKPMEPITDVRQYTIEMMKRLNEEATLAARKGPPPPLEQKGAIDIAAEEKALAPKKIPVKGKVHGYSLTEAQAEEVAKLRREGMTALDAVRTVLRIKENPRATSRGMVKAEIAKEKRSARLQQKRAS